MERNYDERLKAAVNNYLKSLDKRITFEKIKIYIRDLKKRSSSLWVHYKNKFKVYSYIYIKRFRRKTQKKIIILFITYLSIKQILGSFNDAMFSYEGFLFFHESSLPFFFSNITTISFDIVFLALKYFLFYRIFFIIFIYLLIKEIELIPLTLSEEERLEKVLRGYISSIFLPFAGPWLLLAGKIEMLYFALYKYRLRIIFKHFLSPFLEALFILAITLLLIALNGVFFIFTLQFFVVFFLSSKIILAILIIPLIFLCFISIVLFFENNL